MQDCWQAHKRLEKLLLDFDDLLSGFSWLGQALPAQFQQLPYAVTISMPLSQQVVDAIAAGPNPAYYDEYLTVNDLLNSITGTIQTEIEQLGWLAHAVASSTRTDFTNLSGEFPHKTAAVSCGLGWIGRSSLLVTRQYGPRIRLATVLTNLPLPVSAPAAPNACGKCRRCVDACPAGAITGNVWRQEVEREFLIDVQRCDQWKIAHYPQFSGQVCGICVAVCPHGHTRKNLVSAAGKDC